jgi:hypothetical protein
LNCIYQAQEVLNCIYQAQEVLNCIYQASLNSESKELNKYKLFN